MSRRSSLSEYEVEKHGQSGGGVVSILQTATTSGSTKVAITLPPEPLAPVRTRIPIEYRTLSIQVYDSQRFEPSSEKKNQTDSEFFASLDYHTVPAVTLCNRFNVSVSTGLDASAAKKRLERNGPNTLTQVKSQLWKKLLRYTFGDFCSILWIGVIIFFISWKPLGNPPAPYNLALAIVVLLVILMQAVFSGFQDWSAQKVMSSILTLIPENAVVWRDGQKVSVPSSELVVGDLVELSLGQKVPADMRIIKASNDLRFDKSILTGESFPTPLAPSLSSPPAGSDASQVNRKKSTAQLTPTRPTSSRPRTSPSSVHTSAMVPP
jgi:sodium/potassium-transporting ATPase subunit alpha